jgi:hypothetical protein
MKEYLASDKANEWQYIGLDADAVPNQKVMVLTEGGIQMPGDRNTERVVAFAPLIKRNMLKEDIIAMMPNATRAERHAMYLSRMPLMRTKDGS